MADHDKPGQNPKGSAAFQKSDEPLASKAQAPADPQGQPISNDPADVRASHVLAGALRLLQSQATVPSSGTPNLDESEHPHGCYMVEGRMVDAWGETIPENESEEDREARIAKNRNHG